MALEYPTFETELCSDGSRWSKLTIKSPTPDMIRRCAHLIEHQEIRITATHKELRITVPIQQKKKNSRQGHFMPS